MESTIDLNQYEQMVKPNRRYSDVRVLSGEGRIGRFEYFFYSLVLPFLVFWIIAALAGIASRFGELGGAIAYVLLASGLCAAIIIYVQLTIQRCHDFNAKGWLSLLLLLPFAFILFWMIPGNPSSNRFGEPPRPSSSTLKMGAMLLMIILVAISTFSLLKYLG
ncbi:DUF805 domain-containing protein [Leucothrix arctica]|uniref:DUF805 domain-containing protein n=1 Tax=Leucothrix arctica TaxID=1481894 RepID=A0A317CC04_9GAMM|nr:DUF805 domain-containing protein [Leucothrix arctica]PWQ95907.1 hypothetical protein DKT75_11030 [Leucothrix arctica]